MLNLTELTPRKLKKPRKGGSSEEEETENLLENLVDNEEEDITINAAAPSVLNPETEENINVCVPTPTLSEEVKFNLFVHLKCAKNLPVKKQNGSTDAFVKFVLGQKVVHKTKTITKDSNPAWDECFLVVVPDLSSKLEIKVYNHQPGILVKDDLIGSHLLELSSLEQNNSLERDLTILAPATLGLGPDPAAAAAHLVVSLNLVALAASDCAHQAQSLAPSKSNTFLFPPLSPGATLRRRRPSGINPHGGVLSLAIIEGRNFEATPPDSRLIYLKIRLGSETFKSKLVCWSETPRWLETAEMVIQDVGDCPQMEVKLKDARSKELGRSTLDICTLERERTHETSLLLGPDPARSLFLLVTVTGTTPALPLPRPGPRDRAPAPGLLEPSLGSLAVIVRGAEGLPKTSGVGSNLYCVLELDNSRLETQGVHRAANPTWNKMINFEIKDVYSRLLVTITDREKRIFGRLSIPLLNITNGPKWFSLKDKNLRLPMKGNNPELELEFDLSVNKLKAALFAFTPKDEIYLARSERFKRRLFHDNLQRVKQLAAPGEELYRAVRSSIHWDCRWWVARAYLLFLLVTYFFQLWMVPMSLALAILVNINVKQNQNVYSWSSSMAESISEEDHNHHHEDPAEDAGEAEDGDGNVSLNRIMQIVQDAFPLIQNCLGQVASYTEKIKNTFNFSVPFLSLLAVVSLSLISVLMMFLSVRNLIMLVGSVKFIKNIIFPGMASNNELLDFLSRVPDDKILQDTREIVNSKVS